LQPPRGTRDFTPPEMARRRRLEKILHEEFRRFNYREIQTPTFEELELFLAKSGAGIRDEIYDFKDKSGRELALRPELTAPSMRLYFASLKMEPKPQRLYYFGPCYRYDRPQAGRYREFWQMGCELVGDNSPEAHAELLHLALRLFERAGLPEIQLRVGHLGFLRGWLRRLGYPTPADQGPLMKLIDKKEMTALQSELTTAGKSDLEDVVRFMELFEIAKQTDAWGRLRLLAGDPETEAAVSHLAKIGELLKTFGADVTKVRLDPTIARGLEYYTGIVFELDAPQLGAEKQLLGGGAYDLSGVFQQPAIDAVGFAMGFDRTLVALEKHGRPVSGEFPLDVIVGALDEHGQAAAIRAASLLREAGHSVELEARPIPIKKLLSRATHQKARAAILVGAKEAECEVVTWKDLTTGQQTEVALSGLAAAAKKALLA
jgi:histidyl-tRNA synthetase